MGCGYSGVHIPWPRPLTPDTPIPYHKPKKRRRSTGTKKKKETSAERVARLHPEIQGGTRSCGGMEGISRPRPQRPHTFALPRPSSHHFPTLVVSMAVWQALSETVKGMADKPTPSVEQPQGLELDLLPFQREGLAWMCNQVSTKKG